MNRWKTSLGILAAIGVLVLLMTSNAATAVADATKAVIVANTAAQPVPVAIQSVTSSTNLNLDQTADRTTATIDVSHDSSVRIDAFLECVTACASGTEILFTITEESGGGTFIVDQLKETVQGFQTKTYDVPGITWHVTLFSSCHCSVALVKVFHRSN
jgi:hypothetical protein